MTLKLEDQSDDACGSCDYDTYGFRQCAQCTKESAEYTAKLIDWAKRARPWIQKVYSQQVKEREVIEDLYGAQEPYISGLADDIAELEQLLGEVEE